LGWLLGAGLELESEPGLGLESVGSFGAAFEAGSAAVAPLVAAVAELELVAPFAELELLAEVAVAVACVAGAAELVAALAGAAELFAELIALEVIALSGLSKWSLFGPRPSLIRARESGVVLFCHPWSAW
jgi:hypothetical protein